MDRWISDLIITVNALLIIGGFTLTGMWMKFRHERKLKETSGAGGEDVQRLREELDALREDSSAQIAELHERLDFAERLLGQNRPESAPILPPPPTPLRQRVITPS